MKVSAFLNFLFANRWTTVPLMVVSGCLVVIVALDMRSRRQASVSADLVTSDVQMLPLPLA